MNNDLKQWKEMIKSNHDTMNYHEFRTDRLAWYHANFPDKQKPKEEILRDLWFEFKKFKSK
jgi:protein-tyrosine phosphatase